MKALVKYAEGEGFVEIREVEKPGLPEEDWVLIKVKASGVCGTDVHVWQDKFMYWPPVILGHEFSGVIVEVGSKCRAFKVGDRVVAEPQIKNCGICEFCRTGRMHMCTEKWTIGWRTDGSMADYIAMPEKVLHLIPDNVSFTQAALCEPIAIVVYDVAERGKIEIGDFVVVQGSGPIGILSSYLAKRLGAGTVVLTGVGASEHVRFGIAKELGADLTINVQEEDLPSRVMELTNGRGADVVIETSGAPPAVSGSVELLKRGGQILGVGIPAEDMVSFPWKEAVLKSLEIHFSMSSSYTSWNKALNLLESDGDKIARLITWTGPLSQWEEVFQSLVEEKYVKAVFEFDD